MNAFDQSESGVRFGSPDGRPFPFVVTPEDSAGMTMDALAAWLSREADTIKRRLYEHGALLLRGFPVASADDFARFACSFEGRILDYVGGAVPRSRINSVVFNSTEVTHLRKIRMHNELAYQRNYPDFIFFYCDHPAAKGGETPIVDCRRIFQDLDPAVRQKFVERGIKYVRTFQDKRSYREWLKKKIVLYRHLTWQDAFKVGTREEVERLCRERGMEFAWRRNGDLSVSNTFPAVIRHPETQEVSWFNQAVVQHFNRASWGWGEYIFRRLMYPDPLGLPNQAYYGDGTQISEKEIRHVIEVTYRDTVEFAWERGDVLLLDNRLVAHGRNPYEGTRRVYVAMLKDEVQQPAPAQRPADAALEREAA